MNGDSFVQTPRRPKRKKRGQRRRATPPGPRGGGGTTIFGQTLLDQILIRLNFPIRVRIPGGPRPSTGGGATGTETQPPGALNFRAPPNPVTPPVPQTQIGPFRFPNVIPQGADVVLKKGATFGVGRLFGVGGLIISAAEILVDELEERQLKKMQRILEDQDEAQADRDRRRARQREFETVATIDVPMVAPDVPVQPFRIFRPIVLPESAPLQPASQPEPVRPEIAPVPVVQPVISPVSPALPIPGIAPAPVPVVFPNPGQFEQPNPFGTASPALFESPLPTSFFVDRFLSQADPFTVPAVQNLTAVEPGIVPSGQIQTLAQAQPSAFAQASPAGDVRECKPRQCDDELDEPRLECFKGLYRENLLDTEFTPWAEIDCITGKEL